MLRSSSPNREASDLRAVTRRKATRRTRGTKPGFDAPLHWVGIGRSDTKEDIRCRAKYFMHHASV